MPVHTAGWGARRKRRHVTVPEPAQTLFFDADDTLWENNIYFERAIAAFISFLDHRVHTPEEVRSHLNTCERTTIARHGYGVTSFRKSLVACFEQLSDEPIDEGKHERIVAFTEAVATGKMELLPEVRSTLEALAEKYTLILVTKGDREEQTAKLERSGLRSLFRAVEVPREKTAAMYQDLVQRHGCEPASTWMIGNSPRSDINPALAAGLNAVYIPHASTWVLEHDDLDQPRSTQRLLQLTHFGELLEHF